MRKIFFLLFILACGRDELTSLSDVEAHHTYSKAMLGSGYDDLRGRWRYRCIEGSMQEIASQSASVLMEVKTRSVGNLSSIDFQTSLELAKGVVALNPSMSYLASSIEDDFSLIHSFESSYIFSNKIFEPNLKLTPFGEHSKANWRKLCGGEFVSQIVRGASLRFSLRFDFESEKARREFEAEARLADYINEFGMDLSFSEKLDSQNWIVSIFAQQIGGEVDLLSTALPLGANLVSCHSTKLEPCMTVFSDLLDYARDPLRFPSQISYNGSEGAVDIRYITDSYDAIVIGFDVGDQKAIRAYKNTLKKYTLLNLSYRNRIDAMEQIATSANYKTLDFFKLESLIEDNQSLISETILECSDLFNENSKCLQAIARLTENFKILRQSELNLVKLSPIPCAPGYYLDSGYCRDFEETR